MTLKQAVVHGPQGMRSRPHDNIGKRVLMQLYAIFGMKEPDVVEENLQAHYPTAYYQADTNVFFVASGSETTRQIGNKIGLGVDGVRGIIVSMGNFWGRYDPDLWEWLALKQAQNGG